MTPQQIRAQLENLKSRVMLSVGRGVLKLVNDAAKMQAVQVGMLESETRDNMERVQNYGYSSVPHPGAEAVIVNVGGNREHGLVIVADDRRYRVKGLAGGEVCIYTDEGDKIHLKRGRLIEVTTDTLTVNAATAINLNAPTINTSGNTVNMQASAEVNLDTPQTNTAGDVLAQGDINDIAGASGTVNNIRTVYNTHTHNENNNPGGPTNVPNQQL